MGEMLLFGGFIIKDQFLSSFCQVLDPSKVEKSSF
jgi:hypothetical protein